MNESTLTRLIEAHPDRGYLEVACVKAFCMKESSFNEWAYKYEPGYRYLFGDKLTMTDTERIGQMSSWGLMQVMGGVAREYGFKGHFPALCDPHVALSFGMRHLKNFFNRYENWPDAIAAYNAGGPRKGDDKKYVNQAYVDYVQKYWAQYAKPEA